MTKLETLKLDIRIAADSKRADKRLRRHGIAARSAQFEQEWGCGSQAPTRSAKPTTTLAEYAAGTSSALEYAGSRAGVAFSRANRGAVERAWAARLHFAPFALALLSRHCDIEEDGMIASELLYCDRLCSRCQHR